jgi:hypothetical protein
MKILTMGLAVLMAFSAIGKEGCTEFDAMEKVLYSLEPLHNVSEITLLDKNDNVYTVIFRFTYKLSGEGGAVVYMGMHEVTRDTCEIVNDYKPYAATVFKAWK